MTPRPLAGATGKAELLFFEEEKNEENKIASFGGKIIRLNLDC